MGKVVRCTLCDATSFILSSTIQEEGICEESNMKCLAPIAILILIDIAFVEGQESLQCQEWSPICGSDGVTYDNGCVAEAALLGIPPELIGRDWELPEGFISCHEVCPCGQEEKDMKSCHSSKCEEKLSIPKAKSPGSANGSEEKKCIEWSRGGATCS